MNELSLHILDIVQNSIKARASRIVIEIAESMSCDKLTILVIDNGCGMDKAFLDRVTDPFTTTRTTRKVGLGLPLFKMAAELAGGGLSITSTPGVGTQVKAWFGLSHIDRAPLGSMSETICTLVAGAPDVDYHYTHRTESREYTLDTAEVRRALGCEVSLSTPEVLDWIRTFIEENEIELHGGA